MNNRLKPTSKEPIVAFWSVPVDELFSRLRSTSVGLSAEQANQRLQQYGVNSIKPSHSDSLVLLLLKQFKSPITLILIASAVLSFFLQDEVDALIILFIILAGSVLSFWQEKGATHAVRKLLNMVQIQAKVKRNGNVVDVPAERIVPGDCVVLQAGDTVPGDARILESNVLFVDEAAFTGETYPVEKTVGLLERETLLSKRYNSLLMGSHVVSGSATAIIVNTGRATEFGEISRRLSMAVPTTEFERGVKRFGYLLSEATLVLVIIIFAVNVLLHKPVLDSLMFSLAIAVGLTPQLLPAIISVNLSQGAKRMAQQQVIIKRLDAIENFGSMDVLCSDKTGTLTEGQVKVHGSWNHAGQSSSEVLELAFANAFLQKGYQNPIDDAIIEKQKQGHIPFVRLGEVPYDFIRKRLTILTEQGSDKVIISKGALKNILAICDKVDGGNGQLIPLEKLKDSILERYKNYSFSGLRTLGIAYKKTGLQNISAKDEAEMTFAGFITLFDPPKEGINRTIKHLNELGVGLKIITGDNALVAAHVAEQIGMSNPVVVTGSELRFTSDAALVDKVNKAHIFAEVEPNQKERIILALQRSNHVVGYMGDGINDASALHRADVSISVDSAVDVAKSSVDIILLNKDLGVLTNGVREGRKTFANTLKYVFMATSANFGNMFSVAGASLFLPFLPLLPKQILLANILTDLPELAIAADRVDAEAVQRPHRWNISFIRRFMLVFGLLSSAFDFLTFGVLLWIGAGESEFQTAWFVESVESAALIVLIVRTKGLSYKSKPGNYLSLATAVILLLVLFIPFSPFARVLGFASLPFSLMTTVAGIVVTYAVFAELMKKFFYARNSF